MTSEQEVEKIIKDIEKRKSKRVADVEAVIALRCEIKSKLDELYISCSKLGIDVSVELPEVATIDYLDGDITQVVGYLCDIKLIEKGVL